MNGFASLSRAMFLGFLRDKVSLFFVIVFPLMFLVIFGALFSDSGLGPSSIVQVGSVPVLEEARQNAPDEFDELLDITEETDDLDEAMEAVREGDADAAVVQDGDTVTVYYSAADASRAAVVQSSVAGFVNANNLEVLTQAAPQVPVVATDASQVEDESLTSIQYLMPGLLAWAVSISGVFGAAGTLVDWRKNKLLRRLRLSPVPIVSVVCARIGLSLAVSMVQLVIFIAVASLPMFGLQLTDYWWMAIPVLLAGTLAFLAIGMVVGAIAKTAEGASGLSNLIVMPMAFASGAFFPLEIAPQWMQVVSYISPMRYLNDAMLSVMVRGNGPASVLPELGLIAAFTLVVGAIATRMFRWDDL